MAQKFNITLRSLYGREGQSQNRKAQFIRQSNEIIQHFFMGTLFPDNALLAHLLLARFKLGLDQAKNLTVLFQQRLDGGKNNFQRNKAHINNRQVQRLSQLLGSHIADIGPLHDHDSGIGPNLPIQLAVANINGKDFSGTLLQQAVRKTACRCAGVAADKAFRLHAKVPKSFFQLQTTAADVGTHRPPDLQINGLLIGNTGLIRFLTIHVHKAAHNDRLGLGTGIRITLFCQQNVQSFLNLQGSKHPFHCLSNGLAIQAERFV